MNRKIKLKEFSFQCLFNLYEKRYKQKDYPIPKQISELENLEFKLTELLILKMGDIL